MSKQKVIDSSLKNAENWEQKNQPGWVCKCLSSALMNYLSLALDQCVDFDEGRRWLLNENVSDVLSRHAQAMSSLIKSVDASVMPEAVLGGNYHHLVFAHLGWMLGDFDSSSMYIQVADRGGVREISTAFWNEYCRGMKCFIASEVYVAKPPSSLKDLEGYWVDYLDLFEVLCASREAEDVLSKIDESFSDRNTDKSIKDDQYEIEGSGRCPVRWDFRKESIIAFANNSMV